MKANLNEETKAFLEVIGLSEEPLGLYYSDKEPSAGVTPKPRELPSVEADGGKKEGGSGFENFSCVLGIIWRARRGKTIAYFDKEHFGCFGGAFYLGFVKRPPDFIAHYVSTGIPNRFEGERFLASPEVTRSFFKTIDPRPAPARFCIFKPISQFTTDEEPEVVIFFARNETVCGLHQLASFITNDFEAVYSPFGPGCAGIVTWPIRFLAQGKLKAVLGGWDPAARRYYKPDEITFSVSREMFKQMISRWPESFLATKTWNIVRKKIARSITPSPSLGKVTLLGEENQYLR